MGKAPQDDFRRLIQDDEEEEPARAIDFNAIELPSDTVAPPPRRDRKILGLSASERALLSVILFLNVLVLGIGILIATRRIVLPF